jgi:serine/threonine protein kinase
MSSRRACSDRRRLADTPPWRPASRRQRAQSKPRYIVSDDGFNPCCASASCLLTAGAETLTGSSDAASVGGASAEYPPQPGAPRLVDGQIWGPYRVIRLLGRGGMGEVYEAEQLETGRRLALKVLRDTLRGDEDRARFLREGSSRHRSATRTRSTSSAAKKWAAR